MTLNEWLTYRGYSADDALCVTVATDGLSPEKHNILAVSCAGYKEEQDIGTMYIRGADPVAPLSSGGAKTIADITGVSADVYNDNSMDVVEAQVLANKAKGVSKFLVVYSAKFTHSWIKAQFPILSGMPFIDVISLVKCMDVKIPLPTVDTIDKMQEDIGRRTSYIRGGYSFDNVCDRLLSGYDVDGVGSYLLSDMQSPALTQKPYKLMALYSTLLVSDI